MIPKLFKIYAQLITKKKILGTLDYLVNTFIIQKVCFHNKEVCFECHQKFISFLNNNQQDLTLPAVKNGCVIVAAASLL